MKEIQWHGNHITTAPPRKPKKITGTHFATVLGINPFATPFEAWCRCTRTYEKPFEGNQYTNAGQIIEPKVFDFLRNSMGYGNRLVTPEDVYGENHFQKTWGDFFPDDPIFGGSWDALIVDENGKTEIVVEVKTVKIDGRGGCLEERWKDGEAPDYQALQASLYAHKLGIDQVMMVCVPLSESKGDYDHPELVIPSYANENVYIDHFHVSQRYPKFDSYLDEARAWWNTHVISGTSPEFDKKRDWEILKALRTNTLPVENDISVLIKEAEQLKTEIAEVTEAISEKEKRLKNIQEQIKKYALTQFRDGDDKVTIPGKRYEFVLSRSDSTEIDKESLEADGLLEKYTKPKTTYTLRTSEIKEDK